MPHHVLAASSACAARRRLLCSAPLAAGLLLTAGCATRPPAASFDSYPGALTAEQSNDIAIQALGLVGTPYRYGGNTPQGGFDCSGLIGYAYRQGAGQATPRTVARMTGFGRPVPMASLRTGDLVLFGAATPSHAGIYVGEGRFVHAPSTGGEVRLDRLDGIYWSRQPTQARRL
ncbi:C40 family peptidase [Variovorax sp. J22P168]|uniref:C40 family peptidase n=1 Tax=Variovorax jilinensis TaxID=3053513 RepID=UPI002576712E|nr:C40 family peptidase [Variovorax sp. J22P168]MDM0011649.1 C40 family peptidase [Variovorax sp. J22P168]